MTMPYTSSMSQLTKVPDCVPDGGEPVPSQPVISQDLLQEPAKAPVSSKPQSRARKSAGAFRTISEVAKELKVQQHVLRFWETKFSQIRPLKRGGGRRYYRPEDVELLKRIHELLYTEGYTIKGVQKLLREQGKNAVLQGGQDEKTVEQNNKPDSIVQQSPGLNASQKAALETMLDELKELRGLVTADVEGAKE